MSGKAIILVAAGGALGAVARYLVGGLLKTASGFPWATMSVNIFGSLFMGLLIGWLSRQSAGSSSPGAARTSFGRKSRPTQEFPGVLAAPGLLLSSKQKSRRRKNSRKLVRCGFWCLK